ncbi:hypothetical protein ACPA9J_15300 [Pseudomonas aeruginosa]
MPGAIFGISPRLTTGCRSGPATCTTRPLGKLHFWMSFIGMNLAFFPMHFVGPRRHAATDPRLQSVVRRLQHGLVDRRLHVRHLSSRCSCSSSSSASAAASRPPRPGTAPRAWKWSIPRRRPTTPSANSARGQVRSAS